MAYTITLRRKFTQSRDQLKNVEFIKRRILSSRPSWECLTTFPHPLETDAERFFVYRYTLTFDKTSGQKGTAEKEWSKMVEDIGRIGSAAKFQPRVWEVLATDAIDPVAVISENGNTKGAFDANIGVARESVKERCLGKINELLSKKDAIAQSEYFRGIFDRDAQIRMVLSSVKSFLETDGERRNHILLFGLPACAKTQILNAVTDLLGAAAVVRLDGTSTTPAGIYKTYFEDFEFKQEPPFVILEEAEKTAEEALRVWLGVLDDRGELRKVNYREQRQRNLKVLCMATANDKSLFDSLMDGALSSRFAHHLQCPRPDEKVMRLILKRDIDAKGGSSEWIDPVLALAKQTNTDDPRRILAFLDGGKRLLTGEYQSDMMKIYTQGVENLEFTK